MNGIDNQYTVEITCPYCGNEFTDSWEFDNDGELECGDCDKKFTFERHKEITYSSYRNANNCKHEGQTIFCDYCGTSLGNKKK